MKLAILLGLLGLSACHVPNIIAGLGPGGMQGKFDRENGAASAKDQAVIAAYNARKKKSSNKETPQYVYQPYYVGPQGYPNPYAQGYPQYPGY